MSKSKVPDDPLYYYWKALEEYPPLPLEEELELARKAKKGDRKAYEKVILSNLRYVVNLALKEGWRSGVPVEDLISEGNLGLIKAFERFDPDKGVRLVAYADKWIREAITKFIRSHKPLSQMPHISKRDLEKITELYQTLGREPTIKEISESLGISERRVKRLLKALGTRFVRTEGGGSEGASGGNEPFNPLASTDTDTVEKEYIKDKLEDLLERIFSSDILTEKEKIVLSEYIGIDGKPKKMSEIGRKWNVSREYIRQIKESAIEKIRKAFPEFKALMDEYFG